LIEKAGLVSVVAGLLPTHTNAEIVGILAEEHGVQIGFRAVENYTARLRRETMERARVAVQEATQPTVARDVDALETMISTMLGWFKDESLRRSERLLVGRELRQTVDVKLRHATGGETQIVRIIFADPDGE
jgi:hypothetical protein